MVVQTKAETILVVDDEKWVRYPLARKLKKVGYNSAEAENAENALAELSQRPVELAILDIVMPGRSGLDVLPDIRSLYPDTAVIVGMNNVKPDIVVRCIQEGAQDYLTKPFNFNEILQSVDRVLRKRKLEMILRKYQEQLYENPDKQTRSVFLGAVESLVNALESKDIYTSGHSRRVTEMALLMGRRLSFNATDMDDLRWGALFHDVGKIALDPTIQNKPQKLNEEEYAQVMSHAQIGYGIIKMIANNSIQEVVLYHHNFYDGNRNNQSLIGDEIPLGARIVAIADAFDAMTSERPYRRAIPFEKAIKEIVDCSGKQFDPRVAQVFTQISKSILTEIIRQDLKD